MTRALDGAALLVSAAALVAVAVVFVRTHDARAVLPVLLDLLLAAGLPRLAVLPTWSRIATAAAIVLLRRLIVIGLQTSPTASRGAHPLGGSAPAGHDVPRALEAKV
ncbi:MAG TPA: hypothetical protein VKP64_15580 [Mycobacteriales bacterium]|nr:hypothetical protein [Mycobacteriales bacterium]